MGNPWLLRTSVSMNSAFFRGADNLIEGMAVEEKAPVGTVGRWDLHLPDNMK